VNQLLKSVVRKICTLRSVGAGTGDRPGHLVDQETERRQTGLRRRSESPAMCHRETTATAPVLDSTAGLPDTTAVIDGEICSLDKHGRPQFKNLLFHRGNYPCFLAFDLLMRDVKDLRRESLLDRKQELRRLLNGSDARTQYVDYVDGAGTPLFEQHDLEGIVAKQKHAPYVTEREQST
jgi:ATP-dependent DNA ligase